MDQEEKIRLLLKKLRGRLSSQEEQALNTWRDADPARQALSNDIERLWEASGHYKSRYQPDVEKGLQQLRCRMEEDRRARLSVRSRPRRLFLPLGIAAAIALAIGTIALWKSGLVVRPAPRMIVVASGEESQLVSLPDGSRVLLNRNSAITYPAAMTGQKERPVTLEGEAYFDVVPDSRQPFVIQTAKTRIEVLGTSFNVRAYPGEPTTEVEVESGRVSFSGPGTHSALILEAHDRGVFEHAGQWHVVKAPQLNAHAWRTGTLQLRKVPVQEGVKAMERFFGVELKIGEDNNLAECPLTLGNFRPDELPEALVVLETNFGFLIQKIDSSHYRLSGGSCPE